jgi:hypothetical protein
LCPVHILHIQTQFHVLYFIQSILDKPFFLCMWRCSNFVFTKPTKSNARWVLLNSMRKENIKKNMQTAINYWNLHHFCKY